MMTKFVQFAWIAVLLFLPQIAFSQDFDVPDRCFVNGEIDCTKEICYHICFTPPTPGYERMPFRPPSSPLHKNDEGDVMRIEASPRLSVPFKEYDLPPKSEKQATPEPPPQTDGNLCTLRKTTKVEIYLAQRDLAVYKHWVKLMHERIHKDGSFSDEEDNYAMLADYEEHVDRYTYELLALACYHEGNECIPGGSRKTQKQILEFWDTKYGLESARKDYYNQKNECDHSYCSPDQLDELKATIRRLEAKRDSIKSALEAQQCIIAKDK